MTDLLAKMQLRVPEEENSDLLQSFLEDAESFILAYTGRDMMPQVLLGAQVRIAVMYYNAQGVEGQSSHNEGGMAVSFDAMPEDIRLQLNAQRLGRVVN